MKIKKLIMYLIIFLLSTFFINNEVNAESIKIGNYVSPNYYYKHKKGSYISYQTAQYIVRNSDGALVYCVQPLLKVDGSGNYQVTENDIHNILSITPETWDMLSKIAFYGYGYNVGGYNHNSSKWYVATQMLIWQNVDPTVESYFTSTLNGNKNDSILKNEMNEIMDLVNKHQVIPKFNNIPSQMNIGDSITLTDYESVLNNYDLANITGGTVTKNGNEITITATNVGNISFSLQKLLNLFGESTKLYYLTGAQAVMNAGNLDPVNVSFNIQVLGGRVSINKVDNKTLLSSPQGKATLSGAVYGVYKNDGTKVTEMITDSNGNATSGYLPSLGEYYIQEIRPSVGYKLDTTKYSVNITSTNLNPTIQVREQVIEGRIRISKYDSETNTCKSQGEGTLVGAKYQVLNSGGVIVDTLTIGNDCMATSKLLPYDTYRIKEIETSQGYYIDNNIYTVTINSETILNVTSKEQIIKGRIKVIKYDYDNNSCTSSGQATLIGAKYQILDIYENVVDNLIIGNDCTATSKLLPFGHYKVKEISPSKGYEIDTSIYDENIISSSTINVLSKEKVIKNYISILKQYNFVDENTTFLNAESGIIFEIFYPDGRLYNTITTDKNGYASIEIPYGIWKFHQVNTNTGFEKIYDFFITVDENSSKEQYYNILNNKLSAYLKVIKVDEETGKTIAIANTTFKILNTDTNQYVSQFVAGKVYNTFKTNEEGIMTTYLKLEAGNYKLIEVSSPHGYLLSQTDLAFSIGENTHYSYTTYGAFITVHFKNMPIKGQVKIEKLGEKFIITNGSFTFKNVHLDNIVFNIYADEDIKSADGNYIYYYKGDLVDTITTNKFGCAISKKIPLGKYYLVEIDTKNGYVLDTKHYSFELKGIDNQTPIVYVNLNLFNKLEKGDLEFSKIDLVSGIGIPNTKIEIFTENNKLIFSGITDQNGKIVIKNLPKGKYYIVETEASTGYLLTDEKVFFEIKKDGEIVKAVMTNKKIEMPETYNTDLIRIVEFGAVFLIGIGILIYETKKKNK